MRFIVYISAISVVFSIVLACINNKANVDLEIGNDKAVQIVNLIGRYEGNLPCADCSAIATTLVLKKDRTYLLHYMYVGKSDQEFQKTGNWKVLNDILQLDNEDYSYKVKGNKLNQLDLSGKEITGSLANKYILNKVE